MNAVRLAAVAALAVACRPLVCTEMGCSGSLGIAITGAAVDDVVTITLDGEAPIVCAAEGPNPVACSGEAGATITAGDDGVSVSIPTGMTDGAPWAAVDVRVVDGLDDVVLDVTDEAPTWSGPVYPNGEGCDAPNGCWSAELAFTAGG